MVSRFRFFILIGILASMLSYSCKSSDGDVLSESQFAKIYVESLMLEDYYVLKKPDFENDDSLRRSYDSTKAEVFKFYKTDTVTFQRSLEYYAQDEDAMARILEDASARMDSITESIKL